MLSTASQAGVAELVDALGLGSSDESRGGSSPSARTKTAAGLVSGRLPSVRLMARCVAPGEAWDSNETSFE